MDARVLAALRLQVERRAAVLEAGARHVGWKVGARIAEVGPPVLGYLTSASLVEPGGRHDATGARELRAETDLLIEVGDDGDLRCGVALELVDVARPPHQLAAAGQRLRSGDLILAGSLTHVPVTQSCRVAAEIRGVDRVEVMVEMHGTRG
jgi:2-keto-4-pentenoate hydratase